MDGSDLESSELDNIFEGIASVPFPFLSRNNLSPSLIDSSNPFFMLYDSKELLNFSPADASFEEFLSPSKERLSSGTFSVGYEPNKTFQEITESKNELLRNVYSEASKRTNESIPPSAIPYSNFHSDFEIEECEFQNSNFDDSECFQNVFIPFHNSSDLLLLDHSDMFLSSWQHEAKDKDKNKDKEVDEREKQESSFSNYHFQSLMEGFCEFESSNMIANESYPSKDDLSGPSFSFSNETMAEDDFENKGESLKVFSSPESHNLSSSTLNKYDWCKRFSSSTQVLSPSGHVVPLCTSCFVFRQIIHSNGFVDTKLEIHLSVLTMTSHAIVQTRHSNESSSSTSIEQQKLDFPIGSTEQIDHFVHQYLHLRTKEAFVICYDSMISSHQILRNENVTLTNTHNKNDHHKNSNPRHHHHHLHHQNNNINNNSNLSNIAIRSTTEEILDNVLYGSGSSGNYEYASMGVDELMQLQRSNDHGFNIISSAENENRNRNMNSNTNTNMNTNSNTFTNLQLQQMTNNKQTNNNAGGKALLPPGTKSFAAAQRERTGKLRMCDLAAFFHLPITAAAKSLCICPTVLKKICRKNGMRRWPHRKIKSLERIISSLEHSILEGNEDENIKQEIQKLKKEREQICIGYINNSINNVNDMNNMNNNNKDNCITTNNYNE